MHRHLGFSPQEFWGTISLEFKCSYHANWFSLTKVLRIIDVMSSAGLLTNTQILLLNPIARSLSIKDYTETCKKTLETHLN